jgi:hypothetical protein
VTCVCAYTDPGSVYPAIDPTRFPSDPPHVYAYGFAWDFVIVTVSDDASLTNCQMRVSLASEVTWAKELAGWNYCNGGKVSTVSTSGSNRGPNAMLLQRGSCGSGADTLLFSKAMTFGALTGLYTLSSNELWTFWGGKSVRFDWVGDGGGSNVWGPDTHIKYPDSPFLDDRLVRETSHPEVYLMAGGAKFWVPSPTELTALGRDFSQVQVLNDGALAGVRQIPREGTLVKERTDPKVFLVRNQQLSHVSSPTRFDRLCLSWSRVRTVPNGSLGALPKGPVL